MPVIYLLRVEPGMLYHAAMLETCWFADPAGVNSVSRWFACGCCRAVAFFLLHLWVASSSARR